MKNKFRNTIFTLLLFPIVICSAQENQLIIRLKDGSSDLFKISTIKNISFNSGLLCLNTIERTNAVFAYNDISQMHFETITEVKEHKSNSNFFLYPNPTTGIIFFKGITTETTHIRIFNMSGVQVFSAKMIPSVESMDISFLSSGIYFVSMNSTTFKLIKL